MEDSPSWGSTRRLRSEARRIECSASRAPWGGGSLAEWKRLPGPAQKEAISTEWLQVSRPCKMGMEITEFRGIYDP